MKYQLTIEFDTIEELQAYVGAASRRDAPATPQLHVLPTPPALAGTSIGQIAGAFCSGGHGQMRLIPGGTARSGPRVGQPFPPFYKCDTCGERQEAK